MGTENKKSLRSERTQHFLELKGRARGGGGVVSGQVQSFKEGSWGLAKGFAVYF